MKKLDFYPLLAIIMICSCELLAQNITDEGNQWNVAVFGFTPNTTSYSLRIGSDTIINNEVYKIVERRNDTISTAWSTAAFIREDSSQKVYLWNGTNDVLHYDFSLEVGDTFTIESQCQLVVDEIDSVMINNGNFKKRISLAPVTTGGAFEYSYWIEDIGSPLGLLVDHSWAHCATDYGDDLLCFSNNNEVLYPNTFGNCWIETTSITELKPESQTKIFPNPFDNQITISNLELAEIKRISIYSAVGTLVSHIHVTQDILDIDTSNFERGVYLVQFISKSGNVHSKKTIKK